MFAPFNLTDRLLTTDEVVRILNMPKSTFYSLRCRGDIDLKPITIGVKSHRYRQSEVLDYINRRA